MNEFLMKLYGVIALFLLTPLSYAQEGGMACTCGKGMAALAILGGAVAIAVIAALISLSVFLVRRSRIGG